MDVLRANSNIIRDIIENDKELTLQQFVEFIS